MDNGDPAAGEMELKSRSSIGQTLAKVFTTVFSRFNVTIFLVLLQAGYFALLLFRLDNYAAWIGGSIRVIGLLMCLFIIWRNYNPMYTISWIFFIGVLPALGTACYLFFPAFHTAHVIVRSTPCVFPFCILFLVDRL